MQYKHLHDRTFYEDRYDLFTIEDCLRTEQYSRKTSLTLPAKDEKLPISARKSGIVMINKLSLYFITGERYKKREEIIRQWMEEDTQYDRILTQTPAPSIRCPTCLVDMVEIDRSLTDFKRSLVLFLMECTQCHLRKGVYSDGSEFKRETPCPKCSRTLDVSYKRKENVITTTRKCPVCGFKDKDVSDMDADTRQWETKRQQEQALLAKYRPTYCMNEKEGHEYLEYVTKMEGVYKLAAENQERKENPAYQKVAKLQRLNILTLEAFLTKKLTKHGYKKLAFKEPEIDKFVIVPFTILDTDNTRKEYDTVHNLQKALKTILSDTNWRLMSEGITYRLGYLSGRLKGYEHEDDLVKLMQATA